MGGRLEINFISVEGDVYLEVGIYEVIYGSQLNN